MYCCDCDWDAVFILNKHMERVWLHWSQTIWSRALFSSSLRSHVSSPSHLKGDHSSFSSLLFLFWLCAAHTWLSQAPFDPKTFLSGKYAGCVKCTNEVWERSFYPSPPDWCVYFIPLLWCKTENCRPAEQSRDANRELRVTLYLSVKTTTTTATEATKCKEIDRNCAQFAAAIIHQRTKNELYMWMKRPQKKQCHCAQPIQLNKEASNVMLNEVCTHSLLWADRIKSARAWLRRHFGEYDTLEAIDSMKIWSSAKHNINYLTISNRICDHILNQRNFRREIVMIYSQLSLVLLMSTFQFRSSLALSAVHLFRLVRVQKSTALKQVSHDIRHSQSVFVPSFSFSLQLPSCRFPCRLSVFLRIGRASVVLSIFPIRIRDAND